MERNEAEQNQGLNHRTTEWNTFLNQVCSLLRICPCNLLAVSQDDQKGNRLKQRIDCEFSCN